MATLFNNRILNVELGASVQPVIGGGGISGSFAGATGTVAIVSVHMRNDRDGALLYTIYDVNGLNNQFGDPTTTITGETSVRWNKSSEIWEAVIGREIEAIANRNTGEMNVAIVLNSPDFQQTATTFVTVPGRILPIKRVVAGKDDRPAGKEAINRDNLADVGNQGNAALRIAVKEGRNFESELTKEDGPGCCTPELEWHDEKWWEDTTSGKLKIGTVVSYQGCCYTVTNVDQTKDPVTGVAPGVVKGIPPAEYLLDKDKNAETFYSTAYGTGAVDLTTDIEQRRSDMYHDYQEAVKGLTGRKLTRAIKRFKENHAREIERIRPGGSMGLNDEGQGHEFPFKYLRGFSSTKGAWGDKLVKGRSVAIGKDSPLRDYPPGQKIQIGCREYTVHDTGSLAGDELDIFCGDDKELYNWLGKGPGSKMWQKRGNKAAAGLPNVKKINNGWALCPCCNPYQFEPGWTPVTGSYNTFNSLYIYGTSADGATKGKSGFWYPLFKTKEEAAAANPVVQAFPLFGGGKLRAKQPLQLLPRGGNGEGFFKRRAREKRVRAREKWGRDQLRERGYPDPPRGMKEPKTKQELANPDFFEDQEALKDWPCPPPWPWLWHEDHWEKDIPEASEVVREWWYPDDPDEVVDDRGWRFLFGPPEAEHGVKGRRAHLEFMDIGRWNQDLVRDELIPPHPNTPQIPDIHKNKIMNVLEEPDLDRWKPWVKEGRDLEGRDWPEGRAVGVHPFPPGKGPPWYKWDGTFSRTWIPIGWPCPEDENGRRRIGTPEDWMGGPDDGRGIRHRRPHEWRPQKDPVPDPGWEGLEPKPLDWFNPPGDMLQAGIKGGRGARGQFIGMAAPEGWKNTTTTAGKQAIAPITVKQQPAVAVTPAGQSEEPSEETLSAHTHTFKEFPGQVFYMPPNMAYHGVPTPPPTPGVPGQSYTQLLPISETTRKCYTPTHVEPFPFSITSGNVNTGESAPSTSRWYNGPLDNWATRWWPNSVGQSVPTDVVTSTTVVKYKEKCYKVTNVPLVQGNLDIEPGVVAAGATAAADEPDDCTCDKDGCVLYLPDRAGVPVEEWIGKYPPVFPQAVGSMGQWMETQQDAFNLPEGWEWSTEDPRTFKDPDYDPKCWYIKNNTWPTHGLSVGNMPQVRWGQEGDGGRLGRGLELADPDDWQFVENRVLPPPPEGAVLHEKMIWCKKCRPTFEISEWEPPITITEEEHKEQDDFENWILELVPMHKMQEEGWMDEDWNIDWGAVVADPRVRDNAPDWVTEEELERRDEGQRNRARAIREENFDRLKIEHEEQATMWKEVPCCGESVIDGDEIETEETPYEGPEMTGPSGGTYQTPGGTGTSTGGGGYAGY